MICNVNVIHSNTCDLSAYLFLYNVTNLCRRWTPSSSCCCCPPDLFSAIVQRRHSLSHLLCELINASPYYSCIPCKKCLSHRCCKSTIRLSSLNNWTTLLTVSVLRLFPPFSLFLCLNSILRSHGCDVVRSSFTQVLADHKKKVLADAHSERGENCQESK